MPQLFVVFGYLHGGLAPASGAGVGEIFDGHLDFAEGEVADHVALDDAHLDESVVP